MFAQAYCSDVLDRRVSINNHTCNYYYYTVCSNSTNKKVFIDIHVYHGYMLSYLSGCQKNQKNKHRQDTHRSDMTCHSEVPQN